MSNTPNGAAIRPRGQTWTKATPNSWMSSAGDEKLGLVYLPMGNFAADYISTGRPPRSNQVSSSSSRSTSRPASRAGCFQAVKKDVWDYDIGSQPSLIDYHGTPALLVASKQGDFYVLDRATGNSLAPIGTVQAPPGGVEPGERVPTQIVSLWNTLKKPDLVESDMWGMSPIDQMICRIQFRQADYRGEFTPPQGRQIYDRISRL